MFRSKYKGFKSGDYCCTYVGLASVTGAYNQKRVNGKRVRSVSAGHRHYYYIFEKVTSDNLARKMVRLSANQMLLVANGVKTVDDYVKLKSKTFLPTFTNKISYSFRQPATKSAKL